MRAARSLPPARQDVAVEQANATLARILDAIEEYVYTGEFLPDDRYQVVFAGPCREQFLGMGTEDARTAIWADYVHPEDVRTFDTAHVAAHATGRLDVEYRLVGADGLVRWVRDRGRLRHEGARRFLDGSILDVTAVHLARQELEGARADADRLARTDALTGAANRWSLPEILAALDGTAVGVLSLDVDHFKQINDFHGHAAGDAVLVELTRRLRSVLRAGDRVVRMGGEEFLVLLTGVADEAALLDAAEKLRRAMRDEPVAREGGPLRFTVSIGATLATAEQALEERLAVADALLYAAKRAGRDRVRVAPLEDGEDVWDGDSGAWRIAHAMGTAAAAAEGLPDQHLGAVSALAAGIARRLRLSRPQVLRCRLAGLLHDVGKLRVPAAVLLKPAALDPAEQALVRRHAEHGEELIAAVPELAALAPIVRHHHERHDGGGYPDGLAGEQIPLEARIIAAADSWDAMTSDRPYRRALRRSEALAELDRASGTQLDPRVVAALRSVLGDPRQPEPADPREP
jgi:diguanylate cyclase (GGDEF)-like protein